MNHPAARSQDLFTDRDGTPRVVRGACIYTGATRLAELAGRMGFDTAWIEVEHGPAGFDQVEALCTAADAGGAAPTVRVPDAQRVHVLRALECGARVVVVPMVNTADQARQIVEHGKFPPLGRRGYNTRSRGLLYGMEGTPAEVFSSANERTCLFAQVETSESVKNLDAICAVEGLSGIFIGPGDLSVAMGCTGELTNPGLIRAVADCIRRARAAGKHAGILVSPGPMLDAAIDAGADLLFSAGDVTQIIPAWKQLLERLPTHPPAHHTGGSS